METLSEPTLQARYRGARNYSVAQRAMAMHFSFIPHGMEREDIESIATNAYVQFYRTGRHLKADPMIRDDERKRLFVYVSTSITNEKRLFDRLSKHYRAMLKRIHRQRREDLAAGRQIEPPVVEGISPDKVREILAMERTAQHVPLPDDHLLADEEGNLFDDSGEVLRAAVAKLPEKERAAVELNVFEGWTAARIAEEFGKCETTALKTLRRGLLRLRRMPEVSELSPRQ